MMKEGGHLDSSKVLFALREKLECTDFEIEKIEREIAKLKEERLRLLERDDLIIKKSDGEFTREAKLKEYEDLLQEINTKISLLDRKIRDRALSYIDDLKKQNIKKED